MSSRVKLTPTRIATHTCPTGKGQVLLWDTQSPCLAVRATPTRKTFVFESRFNGKTIRMTLGDTDSMTVGDARKIANEKKGMVDAGTDPRLELKRKFESEEAERQERNRQDITLAEIWPIYCKAKRTTGKKPWSTSYYNLHQKLIQAGGQKRKRSNDKTVAGPLYPLAEVKLSDLTKSRLTTWLDSEAYKRPTQCRIAFEALRACLNWCTDRDEYKGLASPEILTPKLKKDYFAAKEAREDCLQLAQLPAFFKSVRAYPSRVMRIYVQVVLLTGARREEIAALRWDDVDFKWRSMTIDGKTGRRTIPLTPYVASLLNSLPRKKEWVFASPTAASGRMTSPTRAFQRMTERAEIPDLTIHGLRRSFSILSEWAEAPSGLVGQIMGHSAQSISERHYKPRPLDLLRVWHNKIEGFILTQAGIEQPTEQIDTSPMRLVAGGRQ